MKKILLIADSAAGIPAAIPAAVEAKLATEVATTPAPVPALDTKPIIADVENAIATLAAQPELPAILGFALTNLRGAHNALKGHLKGLSALLLILALLLAFASPARAQIFYGGVSVTNSAFAPVQSSFVLLTNLASSTLPARTLQVLNIQTNQTITVYYAYAFAGYTNLFLLNSNIYTFPASNGWVNGATFTTNVASVFNSVPIQPYGQINLGSFTNTVLFQ